MPNVNEIGSADATQTGSPSNNAANVPANGNAGETKTTEETVPKSQYEELERKLGEQGRELGDKDKEIKEFRDFFADITPVLEVLDKDHALTQAIVDGKISSDLLKSIESGDITKPQAEVITKAHEDVKKELGDEGYKAASKEEIEKLVADRLSEETNKISEQVNKKLVEAEERRDFQDYLTDFISSTPDFPDFADEIAKWFDEHPEQWDIRVAYEAVSGNATKARYQKEEEIRLAEEAKNVAANAGGGSGQQTGSISDADLFDKLVGRVSNPNSF